MLQRIQQATARINHPLLISAFVDNSGVMEFFLGQAINFKGETHISPSSLATYGGIMTKHGGVIRDIQFTGQGAWPIAGTTIMGICDPRIAWVDVPKGALHPLVILLESIRGTKDYCNPMGIPMAWSQYLVHPGNVKCLALGHSIGIMPADRAQKGEPQPDDLVVLIGGDTGNDGMHGATVSSAGLTHESAAVDGTHVQIGMPIEERVFMEAIPVLRDANCIRACTDCGAAGLSSAVGEMGSKTGVFVNLAFVPLKTRGLKRWEIWLSESQERGVLAIPPDKLELALQILRDYGVPVTVIGVFTDTKRCQVIYDESQNYGTWLTNRTTSLAGEVVVDLPYGFLSQECPLPKIEVREPKEKPEAFRPSVPANEPAWVGLVQKHLGQFNISDQSGAAHQFDQTVQGATRLAYMGGYDERMPDELMATTPILGESYTVGLANACNQFYGDVDPAGQGRLVMAQAMTRLVAAGFSSDDIVCNVNLYTSRVVGFPENAWRLKQLVEYGYAPASEELGMPVGSGKDSCSGTFATADGRHIHAPLTLDVLAVGRMPDYRRLIPKAFSQPGDKLVLFHQGLKEINLGGSVFLDLFDHRRGDKLPVLDLKDLRRGLINYHQMLMSLNWSAGVHSRSVVAEGGLIRRLFEMCYGGDLGCKIDLPESCDGVLEWLFGEPNSAILLAVPEVDPLLNSLSECTVLGEVTAEPTMAVSYHREPLFSETIATLATNWAKTFTEVVI
ncbi:MAG: AIR synthase-related protein [Patescibacteria group bacterium]